MKKISRILIIVSMSCAVSFLGIASSIAAELSGVAFQEYYKDSNVVMALRGLGIKRHFPTFLKIFVAGLYTGKRVTTAEVLSDVPKRLEVAYFWNIPGAELSRETRRRIKMNVDAATFERLRKRIDAMDAYYVDIKAGDRYALTYLPGIGTKFTYNGRLKGMIEGTDFASALFAVWVGARPIDNTLKSKLLGEGAGQ